MAKLKAPGHVSVGGKTYPRDEKTGIVEVPDDLAALLVESHGCELVLEPEPAPAKGGTKGSAKAD